MLFAFSIVYNKCINIGDSDAHQEKPAISFTGEWSGRGNNPVYNCGKVKKVCVDESDANRAGANQEKSAVNFTGKKSGRGNDPVYIYEPGKLEIVCATTLFIYVKNYYIVLPCNNHLHTRSC